MSSGSKNILNILQRNRISTGIIIALSIGVVLCLALRFDLLHGLQQRSVDTLFQAANLNADTELAENIVIVEIDDESLDQLGHITQWPRSYYAELVDKLYAANVRIIVFDVLLSEPSEGDENLARSIETAGNVVLPVVLTSPKSYSTKPILSSELPAIIRMVKNIEDGATALGHANVSPDADGVLRRIPLLLNSDGGEIPSLSLTAVSKYLRLPDSTEYQVEDNSLSFAGRTIPLNKNNEMLINYASTSDSEGGIIDFSSVAFYQILEGNYDPLVFEDKIVIIGSTATGLSDTFWTPPGILMDGVEIHAAGIHTILTNNFLKPASFYLTITLILGLALICGFTVIRLRVLWSASAAIILLLVYFITAFTLFDQGIIFNMLYPPLTVIAVYTGTTIYNVVSERIEKREITETFGRYVSPAVVEKILVSLRRGESDFTGTEQEITVVFADIKGFTSIAETTPTDELFQALNIYLSTVVNAILDYEGIINKFGGDGVMAIWNVPITHESHALSAIKAAASAQAKIKKLKDREPSLAKMEFGIGINTGKALAGNMGAKDRLEYSVIGDTVNIASRLASNAPGGKVWIGEETMNQVKDHVKAQVLPPLSVKGKSEPIHAYELEDVQFS